MGEKQLKTGDSLSAAVDREEPLTKRERRHSWAGSKFHGRHRRSRSASERKEDSSELGLQRSAQDNLNKIHGSPKIRRTYGSQTYNGHAVDSSASSSGHLSSLEKDIQLLQLQLQQERSMRIMLEKAIGRASSTLSPGHRHFSSQAKELVSEIELLEEEVANREQHVLSLYRNIFEQCVSRPPSEQSSVMASPAHVKTKTRKHPSIISSAFCSSKKFPLRPFQVLSSKSCSGRKTSKSGSSSVSVEGPRVDVENICSRSVKVQPNSASAMIERSAIVRSLKDHLYQCPSKLSEEMVRCMASVYCWLLSTESQTSKNDQSCALSKSSGNVELPGQCVQEDRTCKLMIEISSIPTDKNQYSRASYAISNYRVLVEQLEKANVSQMETKAQIAFWINVYNSLIMHAYLAYGVPHSSLKKYALFHKASYNIGGHVISASAIEHAIFCFRTHRIGGWLEAILSTAMWRKSGEEKHLIGSKYRLTNSISLVCFALCTGAFSDPALKVYTASNVIDELEVARREFFQANIVVKKSRKVFLPRMLERFSKEANMAIDDLLKCICENVDRKLRDSLHKCMDSKNNRKASQIVEWLPYNSKFRYVFSKELAAKPWWL